MDVPSVSLSNGVEMPMLGLVLHETKCFSLAKVDIAKRSSIVFSFGKVMTEYNEIERKVTGILECTTHSGGYDHNIVVHALRNCGYRMIDTARRYGVEAELGKAWKASGVPRSELFISSKLWPTDYGYSVEAAFKKTCSKLQTSYLDQYLLHFPVVPDFLGSKREILEETWRQMEMLYDKDRIRSIGVSNFMSSDLDMILDSCSIAPHVNQCEFHPWYNPGQLREYCSDNGILFTGYCPIAKGRFLDDATVTEIAARHQKTPAQICIRYSIECGVPAIPKSKFKERIEENIEVFDFSFSQEELCQLSGLSSQQSPRKIVRTDDILTKLHLPDGYKLQKSVYIPPATVIPSRRDQLVTLNTVTKACRDILGSVPSLHSVY